jgi:PAS domain S-box-containing protein
MSDQEGNTSAQEGSSPDLSNKMECEFRELFASAREWWSTFDALNEAVFITDRKGTIIQCNKAMVALIGKTREEINARNCWEVCPRKLSTGEECSFLRLGGSKRRERSFVQVGDRWYDFIVDPIHDEKKDTIGAIHIVSDVTESRRIEEDYVRLFEAADFSTESIVISDSQLNILYMNKTAVSILGLKERNELIGKNALDLLAPEDRERALRDLEDLHGTGVAQGKEYRVIGANGGRIPVELNTAAMRGSDGKVSGFVSIAKDITEREKSREEIRQQKLILEEIFNNVTEGIGIVNEEETIIFCNPAFASIMEVPSSEILGRPLRDLFDDKSWSVIEQQTRERRAGKAGTYELSLTRPNGDEKHILVRASPRFNEKGAYAGTFGVISDITDRKRHLEMLKSSERELRIRDRISQIFLTVPDEEMYGDVLAVVLETMASPYGLFGYINAKGCLVLPSLTRAVWERCEMPDKSIEFPPQAWGGVWGRSLREARSLFSNESFHVPAGHIQISRALCVPIVHQGAVIGLFAVANREYDYDENDRAFLEMIAAKVAPILHARLQRDGEEKARKAAEEELRKHYDTLEDTVRVRTNELAASNEELHREIEERRRTEAELAAEKERLDVTLRSIGDGVVTTDIEGRIVLMNKVAENLSGWGLEEAVGRPVGEVLVFVDHEGGRPWENPVSCALCEGAQVTYTEDKLLKSRDTTEKTVSYCVAPIRDLSGDLVGAVLVFRDVTEKRRIDEELQKMSKLESIGVLAGGIAHDFNNILTAMKSHITAARMHADQDNRIHAILTDLEKAATRAARLTQQLLTFSKGGTPIRKVAFLGRVLKETVDFVMSGSRVKCEYGIPDNIWPTAFDEGQISQVINNLVINAMQAMPGGGWIKVNVENVILDGHNGLPLESGRYVKFSVRDYGIGIPEKNLSKIFDPYFTTKERGSGLGLATSYSIIQQHQGYMHVDSREGEGATFHVYLSASLEETGVENARTEVIARGNGRILLMDDDDSIRESVGELLRFLGYDVEIACDGSEAVELYRLAATGSKPFDAVIMDLTIPGGMGGKEAIGELIKIDPGVKAIVSSGYSNDPVMSEFKKHGFIGVVAKPYNIEDLSATLNRIIQNGNRNDAPSS